MGQGVSVALALIYIFWVNFSISIAFESGKINFFLEKENYSLKVARAK